MNIIVDCNGVVRIKLIHARLNLMNRYRCRTRANEVFLILCSLFMKGLKNYANVSE